MPPVFSTKTWSGIVVDAVGGPVGAVDGDPEGLGGAEAAGIGRRHRDGRAPRSLADHPEIASGDARRGNA